MKSFGARHVVRHDAHDRLAIAGAERVHEVAVTLNIVMAERVALVAVRAAEFDEVAQQAVHEPADEGEQRIIAVLGEDVVERKLQAARFGAVASLARDTAGLDVGVEARELVGVEPPDHVPPMECPIRIGLPPIASSASPMRAT